MILANILDILSTMKANQKINYDKVLKKMIGQWETQHLRPKILLHSCCGPCSTYTLEYLNQFADVTIYYSNSNIHPQAEYLRRELAQRKFVHDFNEKNGAHVAFMSAPYEPNKFVRMIEEKHLEGEPEGGRRCSACFQMRLDIVAKKADELGFDYFGSALTLSPKKNSQVINELGIEIQQFFQTKYLPSDFKKNNGYQRSIELCKEYNVYRQCYCGCLFAAQKQGVDLKEIKKEALAFAEEMQGAEDR